MFPVCRHKNDRQKVQCKHATQGQNGASSSAESAFVICVPVILRHYAEREGFEPSIPCGIPPFQGGALGHYATSPFSFFGLILPKTKHKVNATNIAVIPHCAGVKYQYLRSPPKIFAGILKKSKKSLTTA